MHKDTHHKQSSHSKKCFPGCKVTATVVALLLIACGASYYFFKKSNSDKPATLDKSQSVSNVGDVENVIAKWIEANPEAIIKSVSSMQQKAMKEYEEKMKDKQKNISGQKDKLTDKDSPRYSPSSYDVTVVEFFDYNCGYCKKAEPTIEEVIKEDSKVRVIFKELPILGESSIELAHVALAVHLVDPKAYFKFHGELMRSSIRSKADALGLVKKLGINRAKVEHTLKTKKSKIDSIIEENKKLAESIGINGTPGFIVGEELIPGAVDAQALKQKIKVLRGGK